MIFDGIVYNNGLETLKCALQAILARKHELKLISKWSYVELKSDKADYEWLKNWALYLKSSTINEAHKRDNTTGDKGISFEGFSYDWQDSIGLLIIFVGAERGRRFAHAKEIWATLRKSFNDRSVLKIYFQNDNASPALREVIKKAAINPDFELRNDFKSQEGQSWYNTFWLQFGFSHTAFYGNKVDGSETELPSWLYRQKEGHALISIDLLLNDELMLSQSFYQLWLAMVEFRRGERNEATIEQIIQNNVWVLPEWSSDIISCLKKKRSLIPEVPQLRFENLISTTIPLREPKLTWKNSTPAFEFELAGNCCFQSEEQVLVLKLVSEDHEEICSEVKLVRQSNGGFVPVLSTPLQVPAYFQTVLAEVCEKDDVLIWSQSYGLWDAGRDVTIFSNSTGKCISDLDMTEMKTSQGYILLVADDLTISDSSINWKALPEVDAKAYFLSPNWSENVEITIDSCLVWRLDSTKRLTSLLPAKVFPAPGIHIFDYEIPITLDCLQGVTLESAFCGNKCLKQTLLTSGIYLLNNAIPSSESPRRRLALTLTFKGDGISKTHETFVKINPVGLLMKTENQISIRCDRDELDVYVARKNHFRVFAPIKNNEDVIGAWILWEGDTPHGRVMERWRELPRFDGLGAAFVARRGYNSEEILNLATSVVDHGLMERFKIDRDENGNRWITLYFHDSVSTSNDLEIRWWDKQWSIRIWKPNSHPVGNIWRIQLDRGFHDEPLAVAIALNGVRLGALWDRKWYQSKCLIQPDNIQEAARMIRWFRLPVLQSEARNHIEQFIAKAKMNIESIWLVDEGTKEWSFDLNQLEPWRRAARKLLNEEPELDIEHESIRRY